MLKPNGGSLRELGHFLNTYRVRGDAERESDGFEDSKTYVRHIGEAGSAKMYLASIALCGSKVIDCKPGSKACFSSAPCSIRLPFTRETPGGVSPVAQRHHKKYNSGERHMRTIQSNAFADGRVSLIAREVEESNREMTFGA